MPSSEHPFITWEAGIYQRFVLGEPAIPRPVQPLSAAACRNERVAFQLAASAGPAESTLRVCCGALASPAGGIEAEAWRARFVEYVGTSEAGPVADMLVDAEEFPIPDDRVQPVWLTLRIPKMAPAGDYEGQVELLCGESGCITFPVRLKVLDATLPEPHAGSFHLDLWQHPGAIARYHRVALWSEPHWALLREYTRMLAEGGQRPITACIIHDPWASQTYDPHPTMVRWIRHADGSFSFDFAVFDRYVQMCLDEGLTGPINCYSTAMGPGDRLDCPIRYWDEEQARHGKLEAKVGDHAYRAAWTQFFDSFLQHLREKAWLSITCLAIDEANEEKMKAMLEVIPPECHVALAGNYHEEPDARIQDYSIAYPGAGPDIARRRRERGATTTFYTCCGPAYPNTFTFSPPVESRLLAWHALQTGCDGYLRWAFTSWPENPAESTVWGPWPSGDTFLAYPGPRSSVRFELLKQGIQDFEAYQLAQKRNPNDPRLSQAVAIANSNHDGRAFDPAQLERARAMVNEMLSESQL